MNRTKEKIRDMLETLFLASPIIIIAILLITNLVLAKELNELKKQQADTFQMLSQYIQDEFVKDIEDAAEKQAKEQKNEPLQNEAKPSVLSAQSDVNISLTADEREYIVRVCMAEAGGGDYQGCMAVAQTIKNRAELWGKTPYEIVTAKRQFAKPRSGALYENSKKAVAAVFDEGKRAFVSDVTHFYSGEEKPYWAEGKTYLGEVGGNKFFI